MRSFLSNLVLRSLNKINQSSDFLYSLFQVKKYQKKQICDLNYFFKIANQIKIKQYPFVEKFEKKSGFSINKKWLEKLALQTQIVKKESEICYSHGRILYSSLSNLIYKNKNLNTKIVIFETGTARGFSALCMAKALKDHNKEGVIFTFDILPHDVPLYWNCIGDSDGMRTRRLILNPWRKLVEKYIFFIQGNVSLTLGKIRPSRIHFAYLDSDHSYENVYFEFHEIQKFQKKGDILIFDDYNNDKFPGVVAAADKGCKYFNYKKQKILLENNRFILHAEKR